MTKSWLLFVGSIFCTTLAAAPLEDTLENDGAWRARMDGDAKTARQARVVISNFGGTWQEIGQRRAGDACRGSKPFPITVQKTTDREVEFSVWVSSVSTGCPDFALTLRVVDARTLAGTTTDGREIRLTREPVKRNPPR